MKIKIDTSADNKYTEAMLYVLNKIKEKLLFDPENKQIVDYSLNLNIKQREGPGFIEERNVLQILKKDGIVSDIGEVDTFENDKKGTPLYEVYEIYHFRVSDKFNEYYDHYQKIQIVTQRYCWFDNNTFFLVLRDGSVKAISFDTERGNRQVLSLFQAIIEHWKNKGNDTITGDEIVKAMGRFGSKVETIQLKNIISNVRNKKIKPAGLEDKIHIVYDRKTDGWKIDITR
jgi:hypothetical protein